MFKKRGYLLILVILLGLLIAEQIIMKVVITSVSAESFYVTKITLTDNNIDIHGGTTNSSIRFTGFFTYKIKGDSLYVKPYYSVIASKRSGDFKILIKVGNVNIIRKIFIVGKKNDDLKQIWQKDMTEK